MVGINESKNDLSSSGGWTATGEFMNCNSDDSNSLCRLDAAPMDDADVDGSGGSAMTHLTRRVTCINERIKNY